MVHLPAARLPVFPLRLNATAPSCDSVEHALALMSVNEGDLHDGFHLICADWKITAVSQYFSPPIIGNAIIDRSRRFGGRYIAALFGSALPGVVVTGIATKSVGLAIFTHGREAYFEQV